MQNTRTEQCTRGMEEEHLGALEVNFVFSIGNSQSWQKVWRKMIECMRNAAREHMTLDEQISFCEEKSKNIKLKAEPQTFVDIKNSLEKLKELRGAE